MNRRLMTKPLPFTEASLARAIRGVERAGRFVVGVRTADGTLLVSDKPLNTISLVPETAHDAPASKWEDAKA
jgi:20S proteasome alpha/beta subunit